MLRQRFGTEYDRAVDQHGRDRAERLLVERVRRVDATRFRELGEAERARFTSLWTGIQSQFVDDPKSAVRHANELVRDVMRARGYSADDGFDERVADLAVDHPDYAEHYRAARALAHTTGENTEELRQAVVHYRVVFADLLQPGPAQPITLRPAHA
jgi:hypothetical protein